MRPEFGMRRQLISRRTILGAAATLAATPALAEECRFGPAPHQKGRPVFLDYDQAELDAAYENSVYEPNIGQIVRRLASQSDAVRARIGEPQRVAYGPTEVEKLDIYRTRRARAPVDAGGDLRVMAEQVRRGIAWVYRNAESFGGDANRLYIGGHSSGGHLCGVALVTDWQKEFELPAAAVKGGLCMSGMYDLKPVRLSWRSNYIKFDDAMEYAMSSIRQLDQVHAAVTVTYGTFETPEFQRQGRDFAAALEKAGRKATLIELPHFAHLEAQESLGNPYGPNGRAAMQMMGL
jgi:arylformamidase